MEVSKRSAGETTVIEVVGRLDASWADHLDNALSDAVRNGAHHLRLDMRQVSFMSSVGVRVLLRFFKQTQRIGGSFAVIEPSQPVRTVLSMSGLEMLFAATTPEPAAGSAAAPAQQIRLANAAYDVFPLGAGSVSCRILGDATLFSRGGYEARHCQTLRCDAERVAFGVGAFGGDFDDCRTRFGEFLAAGGGAVQLPAEESAKPDFMVASGSLVPEVTSLHAIVCDGPFTSLARFEALGERGATPLSNLIAECLDLCNAPLVSVVVIAESTGLVGAALRRSPGLAVPADPYAQPQVRDWLSLTPGPAFGRCVALLTGVAARGDAGALAPLLRPLAADSALVGHFHAAAFSYHPLRKGHVELVPMVAQLFENAVPLGVLHLLNDEREIVGAGQSEFSRGACWVAPIGEVKV